MAQKACSCTDLSPTQACPQVARGYSGCKAIPLSASVCWFLLPQNRYLLAACNPKQLTSYCCVGIGAHAAAIELSPLQGAPPTLSPHPKSMF
eukprot:1161580-Pelagomonas_calceolata.AAC.8